MKKLLKSLLTLLLLLLVCYGVLLLPPVDHWLSDILGEFDSHIASTNTNYIIQNIDWEESNPHSYLTYRKDKHLFLLQGETSLDITPRELSSQFWEKWEGDEANDAHLSLTLRQRRYSQLSPDGTHYYFLLPQDESRTLYHANLNTQETVKIAERVDCFLSLPSGDLLVATGYEHVNTVMLFRANSTEPVLLGENSLVYPLVSQEMLLLLNKEGNLTQYTLSQGLKKQIDSDVRQLIVPENDTGKAIFYGKKANDWFRYADGGALSLSHLPINTPPAAIYTGATEGVTYSYYPEEEVLYEERNGAMKEIAKDVSRVVEYCQNEDGFVLIADKQLCLFQKEQNGNWARETIEDLSWKYSGDQEWNRQHLAIWVESFQRIYVSELSGWSWIWNPWNTESWMNRGSRLRYQIILWEKDGEQWKERGWKGSDSISLHSLQMGPYSEANQTSLFFVSGRNEAGEITSLQGTSHGQAHRFYYSSPHTEDAQMALYQEGILYLVTEKALLSQDERGESRELLNGTVQLFRQQNELYVAKENDYGTTIWILRPDGLLQVAQDAIL